MKSVDFIKKEDRVWFVGASVSTNWNTSNKAIASMTNKERSKTKLKEVKDCDCKLVGWLSCDIDQSYFATQKENKINGEYYVAIYAGKNETKIQDNKKEITCQTHPYLIYCLGMDDSSIGLRFLNEESMNETLSLLENFSDIFLDENVLHYN